MNENTDLCLTCGHVEVCCFFSHKTKFTYELVKSMTEHNAIVEFGIAGGYSNMLMDRNIVTLKCSQWEEKRDV